jgi:hypothetical protein
LPPSDNPISLILGSSLTSGFRKSVLGVSDLPCIAASAFVSLFTLSLAGFRQDLLGLGRLSRCGGLLHDHFDGLLADILLDAFG